MNMRIKRLTILIFSITILSGCDNSPNKYSNDIIKDFKNTFEKIFNSNEIKTEAILNNETTNELTKKLIDFISESVKDKTGVKIDLEIIIVD